MGEKTGNILEEAITFLTDGEFNLKKTSNKDVIVYTIIVERSEYGKVCGAKGKTIRAIKHLWEACIARKLKKPIIVTLKEPTGGYAKGRSADVPAENFNQDEYLELVEDVLNLICHTTAKDHGSGGGLIPHDPKGYNVYISMDDPPDYLKQEFYESANVLFQAMAKANGGNVSIHFPDLF